MGISRIDFFLPAILPTGVTCLQDVFFVRRLLLVNKIGGHCGDLLEGFRLDRPLSLHRLLHRLHVLLLRCRLGIGSVAAQAGNRFPGALACELLLFFAIRDR